MRTKMYTAFALAIVAAGSDLTTIEFRLTQAESAAAIGALTTAQLATLRSIALDRAVLS